MERITRRARFIAMRFVQRPRRASHSAHLLRQEMEAAQISSVLGFLNTASQECVESVSTFASPVSREEFLGATPSIYCPMKRLFQHWERRCSGPLNGS